MYTKYNETTDETISYTDRNDKNLFRSKLNDVLIPCSGENALDISTATCVLQDNIIIGGDLNVLRPKSQNGIYLSYLLSNKKRLVIAKYAQGDSVVHLYGEKIKHINIDLPTIKEQEKVSKLLEYLSQKIELQKQKIEALKIYKKGLMNHLFNNSSNTYVVCLKNICTIRKGQQLNKENMSLSGNYYVLNGGSELSGYTNDFNVQENTISISEGGNSCGFVNFNFEKFWAGGHCYILDNISQDINIYYLYHLLKYNQEKIMNLRVGSGLPNIQKKSLENFELFIDDLKTQHYIYKILNSLDCKIDLEINKFESLNLLKKSLLQQMFI